MKDFDFVLTNEEYGQLNNEYHKILNTQPHFDTTQLNTLIKVVQNNNFQMPLTLQNQILDLLLNAKQILDIITQNNNIANTNLSNNPFQLIQNLSQISYQLNSFTFKNAYQILYSKANNLIIKTINLISEYFSNKNLKIYKFI
ncbi:MAG: hypothetical protein IJ358_01025 [Clostridia bacterium]|nr:hypothetical protein [Clostridia bacterium]